MQWIFKHGNAQTNILTPDRAEHCDTLNAVQRYHVHSGVTRGWGWRGRTTPGDTIQGGWHPNEINFSVAEFRKNIGQTMWEWWQDEKKVVSFFQEK